MPNIEELIHKAIEDGKFDDLPGKGKPLQLNDNPHADPEWQLAYHLLKEAGYSLPWIEELKEIENDIEQTRAALRLAWEWRQQAKIDGQPTQFVHLEWGRAFTTFTNRVAALNKRIRDVNLQVPNVHFQRPLLDLAVELRSVEEDGLGEIGKECD